MQRLGFVSKLGWAALLSFASAVVFAQSPAQGGSPIPRQPTVLVVPEPGSNCPVGFSARRGLGGGAVAIDRNDPDAKANSARASQRLQILLNNLRTAGITGVRITAHGTGTGQRYVPAQDGHAGEITRHFDLKLNTAERRPAWTDLTVRGFTSVSLLDLDEVTFADGTAWHTSPGHTCQVAPSPFMLVDTPGGF